MDNSQASSKKSSSATIRTTSTLSSISTICTTDSSENSNFISKIVLYYVAWLKKLCDWSFLKWAFQTNDNRNFVSDTMKTPKRSKMIERRILKKNTKQQLKIAKRTLKSNVDIDTVSDWRSTEKKQAAKVILKCLKCGIITGILRKEGSVFRIHPKYLSDYENYEKSISSYPECLPHPSNISRPKHIAKKFKKSKKSNCCRDSQMENENKLGNLTPRISNTHFNTVNKKSDESIKSNNIVTPAKPKRPRVSLKRPIPARPQRKQRTKSQTKSPTVSKSRSKSPDKNFKPKKVANQINKVNSGNESFSRKSSNCKSTMPTNPRNSKSSRCSEKVTTNHLPTVRRNPKRTKRQR